MKQIQLTKEEWERLEAAEMHFNQIDAGYLRNPTPTLMETLKSIYREKYPKEIISNNCNSCTATMLSQLSKLYKQYKTINNI